MAIHYAEQRAPEKIEKHYTPEALAIRLLTLVPYKTSDTIIDPASGRNRVFAKNIKAKFLACDIQDGLDFIENRFIYDWAITNPPYHLLWQFVDKASNEARQGFAFLVNINGINTLTPKRLALLEARGFHLRHLHVCQVRKWFGRYYFYVFHKQPGTCSITWDNRVW